MLHLPGPYSSSCMIPKYRTEPILGYKNAFGGIHHRLGNPRFRVACLFGASSLTSLQAPGPPSEELDKAGLEG